jgi:hypothetical protein
MVAPIAYIVWRDYKNTGLKPETLSAIVAHTTGFYPTTMTYDVNWAKGFWMGEIAAIIVHKVANKVGVNKHVRALTGGYLSI